MIMRNNFGEEEQMKTILIVDGYDGAELVNSANKVFTDMVEYTELVNICEETSRDVLYIIGTIGKFEVVKQYLENKGYIFDKDFFDGHRLTQNYYGRLQQDKWISYECTYAPKMDEQHWVKCSEIIAGLIPDDSRSVLDIGCGDQKLRGFLKTDVKYLGVDYCKRYEGCIVADLNKDDFRRLNVKADTYVLAGVMEYLDDLPKFVQQLYRAKYIVFSYSPLDYNITFGGSGRFQVFSNAFLISELLQIFIDNKFELLHIENLAYDMNIICLVKNKRKFFSPF